MTSTAPTTHYVVNQSGDLLATATSAGQARYLADSLLFGQRSVHIIPVESLVSITGFVDDEDDESWWAHTDTATAEAEDYFRLLCEDYSQARHEVKVRIVAGEGESIVKEWVRDLDGAPDGPCPDFAGYCNEWN